MIAGDTLREPGGTIGLMVPCEVKWYELKMISSKSQKQVVQCYCTMTHWLTDVLYISNSSSVVGIGIYIYACHKAPHWPQHCTAKDPEAVCIILVGNIQVVSSTHLNYFISENRSIHCNLLQWELSSNWGFSTPVQCYRVLMQYILYLPTGSCRLCIAVCWSSNTHSVTW